MKKEAYSAFISAVHGANLHRILSHGSLCSGREHRIKQTSLPTSRADYNNPEITPSMAVDGTTSTRWASGPYYPQQHGPTDENWICIDLGAVYDISRVVLNGKPLIRRITTSRYPTITQRLPPFTTVPPAERPSRTWSSLEQAVYNPYVCKFRIPPRLRHLAL